MFNFGYFKFVESIYNSEYGNTPVGTLQDYRPSAISGMFLSLPVGDCFLEDFLCGSDSDIRVVASESFFKDFDCIKHGFIEEAYGRVVIFEVFNACPSWDARRTYTARY